jgi:hypothetical protein
LNDGQIIQRLGCTNFSRQWRRFDYDVIARFLPILLFAFLVTSWDYWNLQSILIYSIENCDPFAIIASTAAPTSRLS